MILRLRIFLLLTLSFNSSFTQHNQWVWMHGDNTNSTPPVYGTKKMAAPGNKPGARYEPCEWTDQQGNLWLFGGGSGNTYYNDLWKYDPATNMWTWINGDNIISQPGIYGTKGNPSPLNKPGARGNGALCWTDHNGNFWLFGGTGIDKDGNTGRLNDLWKYNPITDEWTWIHGNDVISQKGQYGSKGTPAPVNTPGARDETSCSWVDGFGNLWLFGGRGYASGATPGDLNDLWRYNITTNEWTWTSGSKNTNQAGNYGTQGIAAPTNMPGARWVYSSWKDNNGNLWMYGANTLSDLWKYDTLTKQWTWINGPTSYQLADFGSKCMPASTNNPGRGIETRTRWVDDCGNFWLFGSGFNFNDLWKYSPKTNQWGWISGDNVAGQAGVYGTQAVPSPTNKPPSRYGGVSWKNKDGFWIYGGYSNGTHGDLWKYIPDSVTAEFSSDISEGCIPLNVNFANLSLNNCNEIKSYQWTFDDTLSGSNDTSTSISPSHQFNTAGVYNVKLVITSCTGDKDSISRIISAGDIPIADAGKDTSIMAGESVMLSASGGLSYSWYPSDGLSCTDCPNPQAAPSVSTTYYVTASNYGCTVIDSVKIEVNDNCNDIYVPNVFSPNGDGQNDVLELKGKCIKSVLFTIFNRWGEKVFETDNIHAVWNGTYNNTKLNSGVFVYSLIATTIKEEKIIKRGSITLIR